MDKLVKLLKEVLVHHSYKRMRLSDCTMFFSLKVNTAPLGIWLTMIWVLIWEFLYCLIQDSKRSCGCPIIGSIQCVVRWVLSNLIWCKMPLAMAREWTRWSLKFSSIVYDLTTSYIVNILVDIVLNCYVSRYQYVFLCNSRYQITDILIDISS